MPSEFRYDAAMNAARQVLQLLHIVPASRPVLLGQVAYTVLEAIYACEAHSPRGKELICLGCGQLLRIWPELGGTLTGCPRCQRLMRLPETPSPN